nr:ring-opening amidohydrolase [Devosia faecipullorum]
MRCDVFRFPLSDPGDVSELEQALLAGDLAAHDIVAVIGKTHGNGLVNDHTRGYLTLSLALLIARHTGETPEAVRQRVPFVFSGGVEGVLSAHYTVFAAREAETSSGGPALAIGVAFTPDYDPGEIGRQIQIDTTAIAVQRAMASAGIASAKDVHFVQVKGPAFGTEDILAAKHPLVSDNAGRLMALGRSASAFGIGKALGEISTDAAVEAAVLKDFWLFTSVGSCSAGTEVRCNEVIVVGMSEHWSGPLTIAHGTMADALDIKGIHAVLNQLDMTADPQLDAEQTQRLRAGFIKCEASRSGKIRGRVHTMLTDGDIDQQRHIRGAVGAIAASVLGDTALFVSGGAEHQGPDGGGMLALIVERASH